MIVTGLNCFRLSGFITHKWYKPTPQIIFLKIANIGKHFIILQAYNVVCFLKIRIVLNQKLHQKLLLKFSPQQIQLMKLLQVPTAQLEQRIKEELEGNPALEEGASEETEVEETERETADPVIETCFCGLNSVGLLALATFSTNSKGSLCRTGIRRSNFRE